jgi:HlyD family secretion protein
MSEKAYINDPEQIRINEQRELQALLGRPPGRLLHYGITIVAFGVVVLLGVSWLVRYPDIVPAQIQLTTQVPPIRVIAETSGKLSEFRIADNTLVKEGEVIAVLDDPADWQDIIAVDEFLRQLQLNLYSRTKLKALEVPRSLRLGDLQTTYAAFLKRFDEHLFFLKNNNTPQRIDNLESQIKKLEALENSLKNQERTLKEVVEIAEETYQRTQTLRKSGDASEKELSEDRALYLQAKQRMETLNEDQLTNRLLIEQTRMQILEINQSYTDGRSDGMLSIQEEVQRMQAAIDRWQQSFLILAPVTGHVSLDRFRASQQYINQNELLLTIVPEAASNVIGEGFLPPRGSGKVKQGMRANIRFDAYPYQEFGSVQGQVQHISLVPQPEGFQVKLSVPDPLVTTYGDTIPFQQRMRATANIVTEEQRLLLRIFDRLFSLVANE